MCLLDTAYYVVINPVRQTRSCNTIFVPIAFFFRMYLLDTAQCVVIDPAQQVHYQPTEIVYATFPYRIAIAFLNVKSLEE